MAVPAYLIIHRLQHDADSYLLKAGFSSVATSVRVSPLGETVSVSEVVWDKGGEPPTAISVNGVTLARLLDRFYLPIPPDPSASTLLLNVVARQYDELVDTCRNYANIERLLNAVIAGNRSSGKALSILDFGCGTGLSVLVLASYMFRDEPPFEMDFVGTDTSATMLELARTASLKVLTYSEWQRQPTRCFDGIIASYVVHCGLTDEEWGILARQLADGAIFAANYHHADARA